MIAVRLLFIANITGAESVHVEGTNINKCLNTEKNKIHSALQASQDVWFV
jgi:hypothetical protein